MAPLFVMSTNTHQPARPASSLRFPLATPPEPGVPVEVAEGVLWLRMALPFALDHINLWLIEDGEGWTLVDTGIANAETKALWDQVLAHPALKGKPARRLICTHFHPDHMGLAGWLTDHLGIDLWATQAEWTTGMMLSLDSSEALIDAHVGFYRRAGFSEERLDLVRRRGNGYASRVAPLPRSYRRIEDGQTIAIGGRSWQVIVGRGHAPEHATLYCEEAGVLISGDQILPTISPNVSLWPNEPEANPLDHFLRSLRRFADLPAETLTLPSHGLPFYGVSQRVAALLAHHAERLEATVGACGPGAGRTAAEMVPDMFRRTLDDHQLFFAVGEVLAHLRYLEVEHRVVRDRRGDGAVLYRRLGS